jgi:hypothetical protein
MSDEPQLIHIDNTPYLIDDISDTCKEMLNAAQQTSAALGLFGTLLQAAQVGADLNMKEAMKLLPEPYKQDDAKADSTAH